MKINPSGPSFLQNFSRLHLQLLNCITALGLGCFCFFPALLPEDMVFVQNNCFPWHLTSC